MISPQEEEMILEKAYVPEHIIPLMVGISKAEPFFREDHLFFFKENWLIFIGFPLEHGFQAETFTAALEKALRAFHPALTWFIAPRVPESFLQAAQHREADEYYKLDLSHLEVKKGLRRALEKASPALTIERSHHFSRDHADLTLEFLRREKPLPRIEELFLRMPDYVAHSPTSLLLSARDRQGNLSSFYVLELGAKNFLTYVLGCFSRSHYIPHASDLLFFEMINVARESHKEYIHLGLGVDEGIRRFKNKWGGIPFLKYEFCEFCPKPEEPLSWIQRLEGKI